MSQTYELKTKYFVGPIQKLLELIVEKKLDINEMSMAEVTADFLAYLSMLRDISPALHLLSALGADGIAIAGVRF